MLFSMISSMFRLLPLPETTKLMLTGLTEITNGIKAASQSPLTPACRYLLAMTFTAFGWMFRSGTDQFDDQRNLSFHQKIWNL